MVLFRMKEGERMGNIEELRQMFEQCSEENLDRVVSINKCLINLTTAQLEYLLELSRLLFSQSPD